MLASKAMLRRIGIAAAVVLCLLAPPSAALASGAQVLKDCAQGNGGLSRKYSEKDYEQALKQMPSDLREYSDCESIIRRAMLGVQTPHTPGATSRNPLGGTSPQEVAQAKKDIASALKSGAAPQRIGTSLVTPGALSYHKVSAAVTNLPKPLLVVVVLALIGTGMTVGRLVRSRAGR